MKKQRLTSAEVAKVFAEGKFIKQNFFFARVRANNLPRARMSPIVARKTGDAVVRNRIKRRLRAAWQKIAAQIPTGYDYAIIAKPEIHDLPFTQICDSLRRALSVPV